MLMLNIFLAQAGGIMHGDRVVLLAINSDFHSPVQSCT